jgi:hypothetical protein
MEEPFLKQKLKRSNTSVPFKERLQQKKLNMSDDFKQVKMKENTEHFFSPDWLSNLFDEDNLTFSRGDYSSSLSDLIDAGHEKALETYLETNLKTGLKTKMFDTVREKYGENVFRPILLTTVAESWKKMIRDLNL